ncbi:uncharacterized protein LOC122311306 isoform X1 [Carya illinoinensis]|uniref:uncharacterized protein LOC122311306 isoform X1 n=1 Tax=Carya illinoinensis TaxID=32201 RepID=UPI001C7256A0|nr:uncharacterized protein LOC122311306 isoform X1 [Carya illinoinensis]XP_042981749.1 uncharacterized protein LOC122311306 isoform X1 [Carya illinoinensis]XP_042981750.1 uncharacterized protein LOC122311306 isoform X1 [Carya illinoinensis]
MTKGDGSEKRVPADHGFTDIVLSWSLEDIENEDLYKYQVENIPQSFESVDQYFGSYVYPLLEETRAELHSSMEIISRAPFAEVIVFHESKAYGGTKVYDVEVDQWRNRFTVRGEESYKTLPGDVFVLADAKPEDVSDLQRIGRQWAFVAVTKIPEDVNEDDSTSTRFKVKALKDIELDPGNHKSLFVIFLTNTTPNKRIWNALHMPGNLQIIKKVLCTNSLIEEDCDLCSAESDGSWHEKFGTSINSKLNEPQTQTFLACLRKMHCSHKTEVELIWGPPGTGKTKIISTLLLSFFGMGYRTLTCAPTNVAITGVASCITELVKESLETNDSFCSLGDILLFGNKGRLKLGTDIEEIYLDYRVERLTECLGHMTGWRHCFDSMIDLLEDCVSQYHMLLENESIREREKSKEKDIKEESREETDASHEMCKSFLDFVRKRFVSISSPLKNCLLIFCTHLPKSYTQSNFQNMISLIGLLESFETLLFQDSVESEVLEELFSRLEVVGDTAQPLMDIPFQLQATRRECLSGLKTLKGSFNELELPMSMNKESIMDFCLRAASLLLCTASSSYKLHSVVMKPLNILVIDEAAQLKECESAIPLQLRGLRHAILVGDECQLPAMVESNISSEAGFGRSLFERMSSLGHSKHLLNIQYRMHPSISFFPNMNFYCNRILDAPNVKRKGYKKHYLPGPMFGTYSFINIVDGREEQGDVGYGWRNLVEVAVVMKILLNLYKAWVHSRQKLSIGVISPYAAQVVAIQDKLGRKYVNIDGFTVKVKSVDGFQGGEEDIIIISTVRSNKYASIGFLSNPQRTNVALTRARHCLWILGNEGTLGNSVSIWKALVLDAKKRQCFFNADEDKDLHKALLDVKREFEQFDDLLNGDSLLFRSARWKVLFSDNFLKSFKKLKSVMRKNSVIELLLKLSRGWRPKKRSSDPVCGSSSQIIKQFKVEDRYIVCAYDIRKEWSDVVKELRYYQVLKVWDILPAEEIPKLIKRLDSMFGKYTDDFLNRCKEKCLEGDLEVPKSWSSSFDIVRIRNVANSENESDLVGCTSDGRSYVENAKVSESLMLMKFYSFSSGVVGQLLSNKDSGELDLPFEVTDQEQEIIIFPRSAFILGRSGTGKTTVLTRKLLEKEKVHQMATELFYGVKSDNLVHSPENEVEETLAETKRTILHQLFVTVSHKLCYAVKLQVTQHVSQLKSSVCDGDCSKGTSSNDIDDFDDAIQFKDIPDSFVGVPTMSYPLVITFHKFLMMLDGTVGNSYFERFHEVRKLDSGRVGGRSVALETFIKLKEVNYERFSLSYWPHFNAKLITKLDSSRVFTEIISHIKGGPQAVEEGDGKLNRDDYLLLSNSRVSNLSRQEREIIYELFQNYEKMKMEKGEFDLADLVIDLHRRLRIGSYTGDKIDFVYIDEVQDLTLSQIALFKYICENVKEGFVFSGDTAQTIARGIDFRFQDIRSLFYKKFLPELKSSGHNKREEKGIMSNIFHLSQNFRTHDGVLKLAHSVIELLYHFFPQSIDVLEPENSLVYGEAPILLESGSNKNAIITIFGNSGNSGASIVGFGAEQVILVRDDFAQKEVSKYVGKQALVLTIVECKGLEFQDVLLYNFFGSSPLKNKWRVISEYMKEYDLLNSTSPSTFSTKHNVLCSELKQLYVAITRTRQRLWICENTEEFCKPMFDYWKKKCLVQVRQLDDSLAQAMQVASSSEEWRSRGMKLYHDCNYEIATMCFERAGDTYWERRSKAAGLRATADRMRHLNPEAANVILREAADIFEAIGKGDFAAHCFFELGEYERAGRLYLEKCGESDLEKAGECFSLAGCYELAADVYARGYFFPECLKVCSKGKLFDKGLEYIQDWKQNATIGFGVVRRGKVTEKMEHEFLEGCALHYYELKDHRSMMRFVKGFHSIELMREFLKRLGCFDELLLLEEELGNFLEAANIAKLRGEILKTSDLLGKAGNFKEASMLILLFVLSSSLWTAGSKGWPLKQFAKKQELLAKAKSFAKNESNNFYAYVCTEADVLSNEKTSMSVMKNSLNSSQRHKSACGEIISARKIIDAHLDTNSSKYIWEDYFVFDRIKHSDQMISGNQISIETLVYFWNIWKDHVVNIFKYLRSLETQDLNEYKQYEDFCLNYMGVWRQFRELNAIYLLLNPGADWLRGLDNRFLHQNGKLVSIDVRHLASTAQSYWSSEILSVGLQVLKNLEALYNLSLKNNLSMFCQSRSLTRIYEVAKSLLESKYLDCGYQGPKVIERFVKFSAESFFGYVFPLDWRKSLAENMFSLRESEVSKNLLHQVILENISSRGKLTYGKIGRVVMIIFGLGKLNNDLYVKILKLFDDIDWNPPWKTFIQNLCGNVDISFPHATVPDNISKSPREWSLLFSLHEALNDTYNANWKKENDYISPDCFLYLVERLLILASSFHGYFITSKSSFVEWFIYKEVDNYPNSTFVYEVQPFLGGIYESIINFVQQLLFNKKETLEWIRRSNINAKDYYPLLVLRLVVIICLVYLNSGCFSDSLSELLGRSSITEQLPFEFYDVLRRRPKHLHMNVNVLAEAFKKLHNPLVIVSLGKNCSQFLCADAIFVDMTAKQSQEDMLRVLRLRTVEASRGQIGDIEVGATNACGEVLSSDSYDHGGYKLTSSNLASQGDLNNIIGIKLPINYSYFWDRFEALKPLEIGGDPRCMLENDQTMKVNLGECIHILSIIIRECRQMNIYHEDENLLKEVAGMLDELNLLSVSLDAREQQPGNNMSTIGELSKRLQSRRQHVEPFLNRLFLQLTTIHPVETSKADSTSVDRYNEMDSDSEAKEGSSVDKGKSNTSKVATVSGAYSQSSKETQNKGKGNNKYKKKNRSKGGRKK